MKFVMSAKTAERVSHTAFEELRPVLDALSVPHEEMDQIKSCMTEMREITDLKHMSMQLINGEWVFEINDELMFKHISLLGKIARFIAPIAVAVKLFASEFKREVESINNWLLEKK